MPLSGNKNNVTRGSKRNCGFDRAFAVNVDVRIRGNAVSPGCENIGQYLFRRLRAGIVARNHDPIGAGASGAAHQLAFTAFPVTTAPYYAPLVSLRKWRERL